VRAVRRPHDAPGEHREAEGQQDLERPDRHAFGDVASGLAFEPHEVDAGARQQPGDGRTHEGAE
jgi:hypothetical protein